MTLFLVSNVDVFRFLIFQARWSVLSVGANTVTFFHLPTHQWSLGRIMGSTRAFVNSGKTNVITRFSYSEFLIHSWMNFRIRVLHHVGMCVTTLFKRLVKFLGVLVEEVLYKLAVTTAMHIVKGFNLWYQCTGQDLHAWRFNYSG